jgi:prepilin-type N-terminal cleavage/methylation domain-containing protein
MILNQRPGADQNGFTLIEMAIVLVIIGLIIGAVMKGRDLIKSAQIKNSYESFFAKHYQIVASYYDKTGQVLADGSSNGGSGTPMVLWTK